MKHKLADLLNQNCLFKTNRISILNWSFMEAKTEFRNSTTESVLKIMSPNVTKALPEGWQNLDSIYKAEHWINARKKDSNFYSIVLTQTNEIIGFLFLSETNETEVFNTLRLGYLLTESIWGKGIGSELIKGLVKWSKSSGLINTISGGVEVDNLGSIKVLEKNGFHKSTEHLPGNMLLYKINF